MMVSVLSALARNRELELLWLHLALISKRSTTAGMRQIVDTMHDMGFRRLISAFFVPFGVKLCGKQLTAMCDDKVAASIMSEDNAGPSDAPWSSEVIQEVTQTEPAAEIPPLEAAFVAQLQWSQHIEQLASSQPLPVAAEYGSVSGSMSESLRTESCLPQSGALHDRQ